MTEIQRDLVLHLLRQGDWQDATIAYAEEAGITPREAAEAVRQLAASHDIHRHSAWWMAMAAVASFVSLVAGWVFARPF